MFFFKCVLSAFCLYANAFPLTAKDIRIAPSTDFESLSKQAQPGDTFVLANGVWKDADLKFESLPGTALKPIHIKAETPGKVVFTGATKFRFSGMNVTVSGLVFRDTDGVSDVVQMRTHSERHAHFCRITDCVFEQSKGAPKGSESRWLSVYGTQNRIDHCRFAGKKSRGPTLVVWVEKREARHRIHLNHFDGRPELGRNGGETIRIGTSDVSEQNAHIRVDNNYFHACDGEAEIISNKSCANLYELNVFDACSGALTLRHGHRCIVTRNVFLGRKKRGTGGVRVIGKGHHVDNNYFEGLRGDEHRAALCMMNGIPNAALNSYSPVKDAVVSYNTFIDCKVSLEIGAGAGKKQSAAPKDCCVTDNLFLPDKWPILRAHSDLKGIRWAGNRWASNEEDRTQPNQFQRIELKTKRAADGFIRPVEFAPLRRRVAAGATADIDGEERGNFSVAGCDEPGGQRSVFPSAKTTGPTWERNDR